ncbi:NERD domain-containing protein [Chitinimonas koreensis]|uniref:NERD domain-containing protein n=1 Tax=Chitinimonas koreensis TaxID=356302 RepID=UPI0003F67409|nr:NERD domain-containing protein [Chitinimonas koreensis]QNM96994.1 NERD domain-containing protein [Chitinimonas koreensis]
MIVKDIDAYRCESKQEQAGYAAEKRLAWYLAQYFGDEPRLLILNDLRVVAPDGDFCQVDHLLIHQYGLIIVESKSVSGKIQVNEQGEWKRWYFDAAAKKDKSFGIQSPIKQGQMQARRLRRLMLSNAAENTRSAIEKMHIDVLVAISDGGEFLTRERERYQEVCKADQIDERIGELVKLRAQYHGEGDFVLSEQNKTRLAQWLAARHQPRPPSEQADSPEAEPATIAAPAVVASPAVVQSSAEPKQEPRPEPKPKAEAATTCAYRPKDQAFVHKLLGVEPRQYLSNCRHCASDKLEIRYGKFGYYFFCLACEKNSKIDAMCPDCGQYLKIRKNGSAFSGECAKCKQIRMVHYNE